MLSVVETLRKYAGVLLAFAWMAAVLLALSIGNKSGFARGKVEAEAALSAERLAYATEQLQRESEWRTQLLQQVTRANQTEDLLLDQYDRHNAEVKLLQERIPNVTSTYKPTLAAAPVAIPHCVFTAGWLRDYNLALGVSADAGAAAAPGASQTPWAATGTDSELLESGVSPADILAHAQDYGRCARDNLAQLNALLDLQNKD